MIEDASDHRDSFLKAEIAPSSPWMWILAAMSMKGMLACRTM